MNRSTRFPWLVAGLLAGASVCVQAQSACVGVGVGVGARSAVVEAGIATGPVDRFCVRETGTRIVARRDRERRCSGFAGRSYSREELQSTGRPDIADALRMLDPSIR